MHAHIHTLIYSRPYMHVRVRHTSCLFVKSLQAEIEKNPQLPTLTKDDGDRDPPEIMFKIGSRRVGYFKAKHLCRVWTLKCLRWLHT